MDGIEDRGDEDVALEPGLVRLPMRLDRGLE